MQANNPWTGPVDNNWSIELFFSEKQKTKQTLMSPPFRNKKYHKIAFSYATKGKFWKIYMQELCFFFAWHVIWMRFTNVWSFIEIPSSIIKL